MCTRLLALVSSVAGHVPLVRHAAYMSSVSHRDFNSSIVQAMRGCLCGEGTIRRVSVSHMAYVGWDPICSRWAWITSETQDTDGTHIELWCAGCLFTYTCRFCHCLHQLMKGALANNHRACNPDPVPCYLSGYLHHRQDRRHADSYAW